MRPGNDGSTDRSQFRTLRSTRRRIAGKSLAPSRRWIACLYLLLLSRPLLAAETKSLADCIALALQEHPSLRAGTARFDAAQARTRQVAAAYLPQVSATYAANRRNTSVAARTGTTLGTASQTFNFFNTGVSFTQLLFDFGQNLHTLRAALANRDAAEADLAAQRALVVFQVQQAYYALLAAQQLVEVAAEGVRQSQRHLELAQTRLEVGLAPPLEVTRERAQLANNELNLLRAKNAVQLGRETLRTAIGIDEEVTFGLEPVPLPILPPLEEAALVEVAYERRPELASQRAQRQAATEEVAAAEKNHLPMIQGAGQYQWSGADYPLQSNWNLGAVVTLPLFSGGLTAAQVSEAKARVREMEATETQLQQQIAFEVRQAFLQAREAEESLQVADRALEQAQENFTLAEGRYETGVGSVIELTDAQALLLNARGQRVQAEQNFLVAVAALEKATANPLAELASRAALVVRRSHEE